MKLLNALFFIGWLCCAGNSGFSINLEEYQVDPQENPIATKHLQDLCEHPSLKISTLENEYRLIAEADRKEGYAGQTVGGYKDVLRFLVTYAQIVEKHPENFTFPPLPKSLLADDDKDDSFYQAAQDNLSLYERYGDEENLLQSNMQIGAFVCSWYSRHYNQYFVKITDADTPVLYVRAPVVLSTDSLKAKDLFLPVFWETLRKIQQESMTPEKNAGSLPAL